MRANRPTLATLCLLTALAVPVQRSAFATAAQEAPKVDGTQLLIAQDAGTVPKPTAISLENDLTATTNEDGLVVLENAEGETVAGPLTETGGEVTALAFSDDGETLATGTQTGQVRFWSPDGEPKGDIFQPVIGNDNAITTLRFEDNETLFVGASQGRQGLWGLDGLPPGEIAAAETEGAIASTETADADGLPWWVWLIPLVAIPGLIWLFLGKRRSQTTTAEAHRQISPTVTVPPPPTDPEAGGEVSSRAQTIISSDRVVDESRIVGTDRLSNEVAEPATAVPATDLPTSTGAEAEILSLHESTDLESPDLEGTNLDISTASMALESMPVGSATAEDALGNDDDALAGDTDLEDSDPWDDNLELTLDDELGNESPVSPNEPLIESASPVENATAHRISRIHPR